MAEPYIVPLPPVTTADVIDLNANETIPEGWVARQFATHYGNHLAYCHGHKAWFRFDGAIWRQQLTPLAFHLAHELATRMSATAKNKAKMQGAGYCTGVETLCRANPVFARVADDWDRDIWIMGVPDGGIDLRTGRRVNISADDRLTKTTACNPALTDDCPIWKTFLDEATAGNAELIRFLQQLCGYALTGDISEQMLFFIFGPGGNGKGVFLTTLQAILNDYSVVAAMEALEQQKYTPHPTDLAMLRGARLVSASETDRGGVWNEKRILALTGGDRITARLMRADNMTFTPQLTLIIIGNHKPELKTVNDAMRRRFNMIPFIVKPAHKDTQLTEKLKPEWPAILRWMINGCLDWQANGFKRPDIVVSETEKYFEEQNTTKEWMDTFCDVDMDNDHWFESSAKLFKSWSSFAKASGFDPGNAKTFRPDLERLGFRCRRASDGVRFYHLKLKSRGDEEG